MENPIPPSLDRAVKGYKPPEKAAELVKSCRLFLIAGTAGSGKNSVIEKLLKLGGYRFIVSHTTRRPRVFAGNKREPEDQYHFTDVSEMERMVREKCFFEVKVVHGIHVYGTSLAELEKVRDSGLIGTTDIDVQGVAEYVKIKPNTKAVFLLPPNYDEWIMRLTKRGNMPPDELKRRLFSAQQELEAAIVEGYFKFIVNADLDTTVREADSVAKNQDRQTGGDEGGIEHAWRVLGELKRELSS